MKLLIQSLLVGILLIFSTWNLKAQRPLPDASKVQFGYLLYANYNLYHRYTKPSYLSPKFRSSGQVLNVLPGLGTGFWVGKPTKWWLSLESGAEFAPFTLAVNKFKGMGSLAVPVLLKAHLPVAKQRSALVAINFGAGAQWTWSEIYAVPTEFKNRVSLRGSFVTYIGELGLSLGAVNEHLKNIKDVSFYIRFGAGLGGAMAFNCGLRLSFWNGLLK